jgi:hypothetical protein
MRPGESFAARYTLLVGDVCDLRRQFDSTWGVRPTPNTTAPGSAMSRSRPRRRPDLSRQARQPVPPRKHVARLGSAPPCLHRQARTHARSAQAQGRRPGRPARLLRAQPWVIAEQLRHNDGGRLVLELYGHPMHQRRHQRISMSEAVVHRHPGELREVQLRGPSAPSVPSFAGPPVLYEPGRHSLKLVAGSEGSALSVSDGLVIRA